jgi:periplasmic divalent cation tolerance protein
MASMVYITAKDMAEAQRIAKHLIEKRIIACANIFPIRSMYSWKGKIESDDEMAMIIKTRDRYVDQIIKEVGKIHSYEVPCIVSYKIDKGEKGYLDWIREVTDVVTDLHV